jgi:hypothetical protein
MEDSKKITTERNVNENVVQPTIDARPQNIISDQTDRIDRGVNSKTISGTPSGFISPLSDEDVFSRLQNASPSQMLDLNSQIKDVLSKFTFNGSPITQSGNDLQINFSPLLAGLMGSNQTNGFNGDSLHLLNSFPYPSIKDLAEVPINAAISGNIEIAATSASQAALRASEPAASPFTDHIFPPSNSFLTPDQISIPNLIESLSQLPLSEIKSVDAAIDSIPKTDSEGLPRPPEAILADTIKVVESAVTANLEETPTPPPYPLSTEQSVPESNAEPPFGNSSNESEVAATDTITRAMSAYHSDKIGAQALYVLLKGVPGGDLKYVALHAAGEGSPQSFYVPTFPFLDWSGSNPSGYNLWFGTSEAKVYTIKHQNDNGAFIMSDVTETPELKIFDGANSGILKSTELYIDNANAGTSVTLTSEGTPELTLFDGANSGILKSTELYIDNANAGTSVTLTSEGTPELTLSEALGGQAKLSVYEVSGTESADGGSWKLDSTSLQINGHMTGNSELTTTKLTMSNSQSNTTVTIDVDALDPGKDAKWQEIDICVDGTSKKMKVLGTEPY